MRTVAVIQARMGSSRLPGKVLRPLGGVPMLRWVTDRLQQTKHLDEIIVATSTLPADDAVAAASPVRVVRGDEKDVLSRYVLASEGADVVVRITADCPLIDAATVDAAIALQPGCDYASNVIERTYPRGLDVEVFTREALLRCHREGTSAAAREHVTWYIREEARETFSVRHLRAKEDHSDLRWTVDTAEDFAFMEQMAALGAKTKDYAELLGLVSA